MFLYLQRRIILKIFRTEENEEELEKILEEQKQIEETEQSLIREEMQSLKRKFS